MFHTNNYFLAIPRRHAPQFYAATEVAVREGFWWFCFRLVVCAGMTGTAIPIVVELLVSSLYEGLSLVTLLIIAAVSTIPGMALAVREHAKTVNERYIMLRECLEKQNPPLHTALINGQWKVVEKLFLAEKRHLRPMVDAKQTS